MHMLRSIRFVATVASIALVSPAGATAGDRPWRASHASCSACRPCGPWLANRIIPQGGYGVDFRPACQRHDDCYLTPGASRRECDRQFLNDMRAICANSNNPRGCNRRATVYYRFVRLFGGVARSVEGALP
jgi:hypothetical protein